MRAEPARRAERAGDVDAASRADRLGEGEALRHRLDVLLPRLGVGVEEVDPAADLGDHDVVARERGDGVADARLVVEPDVGAVGRAVALGAVGAGERVGVVALHGHRRAETQPRHRAGGPRERGRRGRRRGRGAACARKARRSIVLMSRLPSDDDA